MQSKCRQQLHLCCATRNEEDDSNLYWWTWQTYPFCLDFVPACSIPSAGLSGTLSQFLCEPVCLPVHLSVSVCVSLCVSLSLCASLSVCLCVCLLFVYQSVSQQRKGLSRFNHGTHTVGWYLSVCCLSFFAPPPPPPPPFSLSLSLCLPFYQSVSNILSPSWLKVGKVPLPLSFSVCLSVCLSLSLSLPVPLSLSLCVCLCLSVCLSVSPVSGLWSLTSKSGRLHREKYICFWHERRCPATVTEKSKSD